MTCGALIGLTLLIFLEERHDIRQLIFDSFTKHGKKVSDSVIGKIDNTEAIIRMLIAHRKAGIQ